MDTIIWNWIPLISIGPIIFNDTFNSYTSYIRFTHAPNEDADDWKTFKIQNSETRIAVENGLIVEIHCYDNFFFNGVALIGLELEQVLNIIGNDFEIDTDDCLKYDSKNCMIFHDDGIVESISVMGAYDED